MSKNYNKIFNRNEPIVIPCPVPVVEIPPMEHMQKQPEVEHTSVVKAIVTDCKRLNVRAISGITGKVLEIIPNGSEVVVFSINMAIGWAHILTQNNIDGYVMSQYIKEV